MSKENKTQDFLDKIFLHSSLFWKDGPRSEVIVYLDTEKGLSPIGADQSRHGVSRDVWNCENELAQMFDSALKATRKVSFDKDEDVALAKEKIGYYLEVQYSGLDVEKLNKTLDAFSKNRVKEQEAFNAHCVWGNAMRSISMQYARPGEYDVKAMEVYTAYLTDLVRTRLEKGSLDSVAVPDDRLSFLDKLSGKSYTWGVETLKHDVAYLTDEQVKKLASQIEAGFPSKETCEFYSGRYNEEAIKYRRQYPSKLQDEMRQDILNGLTMRAVEDALKGKYYDQSGDISIFMDKEEKEKFEKMSFAQMKEEYGLDLLKTNKGAVMIELKLKEAKEKGGATLEKALDSLTDLLEERRTSPYCPDISDEVQYRLLKGIKKSYQKFGAGDVKFRKVFEKMMVDSEVSQQDLAERVQFYKDVLDGNLDRRSNFVLKSADKKALTEKYERLVEKQLKRKKFFAELKELSSGKADITKVKASLKARKAAKAKETIENTGFAANTVLAAHAMEGYGISSKAVESEKKKISEKRQKTVENIVKRSKDKGKGK